MSRALIVGDIHGCFHTLQALLEQIQYTDEDRIYFLGDVIGKGPHSHLVMDFIMSSSNHQMILGNHETAWLKASLQDKGYHKQVFPHNTNCNQYQAYLLKQPFLMSVEGSLLVHAAVDPSWYIDEAFQLSEWLSRQLQEDPASFFLNMQKPSSLQWKKSLSLDQKRYLALQIFTRCRYYQSTGELDLSCTDAPEHAPELIPWYQLPRKIQKPIYFGHWASLRARNLATDFALDGGAVYGGKLVAIDMVSSERWEQDRVKLDG